MLFYAQLAISTIVNKGKEHYLPTLMIYKVRSIYCEIGKRKVPPTIATIACYLL